MTRPSIVRIAPAFLVAALLLLASGLPATAATKSDGDHVPHDYLALGDSIPFGLDPFLVQPGVDPDTFVGYPELALPLFGSIDELANASCPGETSASLIDVSAPDNGCGGPGGYRSFAALHVSYPGSQLAYAEGYLEAHPGTRLISITIGANDPGPLIAYCTEIEATTDALAACINKGLTGPYPDAATGDVLENLAANLTTIFSSLFAAGFHGQLVAVTYYSTDYADVFPTEWLAAIDHVLASVTRHFGGKVANAFAAFKAASAPFGGDACAAGLLIPDPPSLGAPPDSCNNHPSPAGAELLAATLRAAA